GGLASYGADLVDQYRRAAGYAGRILKGEEPADLPGQAPTKYELGLKLKTPQALGLGISAVLPARPGEVSEGEGATSSSFSAAWRRGRSRRARSRASGCGGSAC